MIPHEHGPEQLPEPLVLGRKGEAAGQTHTELALLLAQGGLTVYGCDAAQRSLGLPPPARWAEEP